AGIKQAQDAKAREAALAKERQQAEQVRQLVAAGRAATAKGQYDAAAKSLGEANALAPKDATVQQALRELAQAEEHAAAEADKAGKHSPNAVRAYGEALRVVPNDPAATKALKDAQAALDASKAPPPPPPAEYTRQMDAAAALEKQQKYADAVSAYKAALKVV